MGLWDTVGAIGGGILGGGVGALGGYALGGGDLPNKQTLLGGAGMSPDPRNAQFANRDYITNRVQGGIEEAYLRQAPQAGQTTMGRVALGQAAQLDPSQQGQFRDMQLAQANRMGQIASGQAKGAGELAVDRQMGQAAAAQQAAARMQRGFGGASAARGAARNMAGLGVAGAGQARQAALGDQMAAGQMLGSLSAQGREADIGMAGTNAQLQQQRMLQQGGMDQQSMLQQGQMDQQRNLANIDAQLRMQGMNDQTRLAYLQQLAQMNQAEMAGRLGQEQVAMNQTGILPGLLQAGGQVGAAAAMSDKRAKKNIKHGGMDVDELLDKLKPTSYEYKEGVDKRYTGELGDGRRIAGFLAQDLEKSKAGKAIVSTTPEGSKVVNVAGGMFAALAATARLNERLSALEGKKG